MHVPKIKPSADGALKQVFAGIGTPAKTPFTPDPFQRAAVKAIRRTDCLVTVPTGAGKTWVAEEAIRHIFAASGNSWYATPLKALTNSKYKEFSQKFGATNVGILTGDRKENPQAPIIVGTTEILRNQLYDAMHTGQDLSSDFVVLDEAHFLGDADRGVVWEEIMIYLPARIPLLMLSATIGNADQVAAWLSSIRKRDCKVIGEARRPVPLFPLMLHPSGMLLPMMAKPSAKRRAGLHKKVRQFLNSRARVQLAAPGQLPPFGDILRVLRKYRLLPAIFFLKSRADCDNALKLCEDNRIHDAGRIENISRRIETLTCNHPHAARHRQRRHLEHSAVGAHHSGQLPVWKLVLESLMTEGLLDAVFATSTVAAGVNFPARTVVFLNSDRFNGREFLPLSPTEFHQATGRAGRRGMDRIGFAIALPGRYMDLRLIARLLHSPPSDVRSQIRINFSMALNLLLSHLPDQIEELLERSFAAYLIAHAQKTKTPKSPAHDARKILWNDFQRHLRFLEHAGYVDPNGRLTADGVWASQLRVDQPLLIAEGFRRKSFPRKNPALLAAVMAAFVNEREFDAHIERNWLGEDLLAAFKQVQTQLKPFAREMIARGFEVRPLYLRPAVALHAWAHGHAWEDVQRIAELEDGNLAMLILRTADNLRHIKALRAVFPEAAATAGEAIERILREPVLMD